MERTRKTSEELDLEMRRTRGPNKHLERRTARERERERRRGREREGERSKGTSWREQGGQARRQTFPKPPERRTQSHGKRSEGMGNKEVPMPRSTQEEEQ